MATLLDILFGHTSPENMSLAVAAHKGRIRGTERERTVLHAAGYPPSQFFLVDISFAANMLVEEAVGRADPERALDELLELLRTSAHALLPEAVQQSTRRGCNCPACQESEQELAQFMDALKAYTEQQTQQYLTEKDIPNVAGNANESSPWGFGVARSEQVHPGELPVSDGQDQHRKADGEGGPS